MNHDDLDLSGRFEPLRRSIEPLEGARAAIDRAVVRRRRRPLVAGTALAGAAAAGVLAVVLLPGVGVLAPRSGTASMATDTQTATESENDPTLQPGGPGLGFVPVETSGRTVGEWAASADVLVVVSADDDGALATVTAVAWHRATQPGEFALEALPLGEDGEIALGTVAGTPSRVALSPAQDYLVAMRWDRVRCDGRAPGWITLGDDAVLALSDGAIPDDAVPDGDTAAATSELDARVSVAFAGLTAPEVGDRLDELDLDRARDLCA